MKMPSLLPVFTCLQQCLDLKLTGSSADLKTFPADLQYTHQLYEVKIYQIYTCTYINVTNYLNTQHSLPN